VTANGEAIGTRVRARGALRRSVVPSLSDRLRANGWTISNIRPGSSRWSVTGSADESGSRSRRWACRWMTRMRSWFGPRRGESAIKRAGMLAGRRGAHHRSQQHPLILRPAHTERVHGLREAGVREVLEHRRAEEERPDLHSNLAPRTRSPAARTDDGRAEVPWFRRHLYPFDASSVVRLRSPS
jgi:hypothetical protein